MTTANSYFVRPRHHGYGHIVEAASFEEAALAFVERWSPPVDQEGDVALIVRDRDNGHELCLRLDLDSGQAAPCS